MKQAVLTVLIALAGLVGSTTALADDDWKKDTGVHHSLVVYLMGPTIDGTMGIGPLDADVSIDPSTVFDSLDAGFLAAYFVEEGRFGLMADLVYMDLSADGDIRETPATLEIGNKQLVLGLLGTYRLSEHWRAMGGLMYTDVEASISVNGASVSPNRSRSEDWADPVVGLHYSRQLSDRWSFAGFGQVGGFGVNADLVWQLTGSFSFQMSERTHLALGYRYMDFDYETGAGKDRFKFDVSQYGPALGVRFNF